MQCLAKKANIFYPFQLCIYVKHKRHYLLVGFYVIGQHKVPHKQMFLIYNSLVLFVLRCFSAKARQRGGRDFSSTRVDLL